MVMRLKNSAWRLLPLSFAGLVLLTILFPLQLYQRNLEIDFFCNRLLEHCGRFPLTGIMQFLVFLRQLFGDVSILEIIQARAHSSLGAQSSKTAMG
jgi:hypothetical protein